MTTQRDRQCLIDTARQSADHTPISEALATQLELLMLEYDYARERARNANAELEKTKDDQVFRAFDQACDPWRELKRERNEAVTRAGAHVQQLTDRVYSLESKLANETRKLTAAEERISELEGDQRYDRAQLRAIYEALDFVGDDGPDLDAYVEVHCDARGAERVLELKERAENAEARAAEWRRTICGGLGVNNPDGTVRALSLLTAAEARELIAQGFEQQDSHIRKLTEEVKDARDRAEKADSRLSSIRSVLSDAGVPDIVQYHGPDSGDEYEMSLRAGGRSVSIDARVRALVAERDAGSAARAALRDDIEAMRLEIESEQSTVKHLEEEQDSINKALDSANVPSSDEYGSWSLGSRISYLVRHRDESVEQEMRLSEERSEVWRTLNPGDGETLVEAAKRVAHDTDQRLGQIVLLTQERDFANAELAETREALGAREGEATAAAAHRVVESAGYNVMAMAKLAEQERAKHRRIPVSESLPNEMQLVVAFNSKTVWLSSMFLDHNCGVPCWYVGAEVVRNGSEQAPTHWTPLPEPPSNENETCEHWGECFKQAVESAATTTHEQIEKTMAEAADMARVARGQPSARANSAEPERGPCKECRHAATSVRTMELACFREAIVVAPDNPEHGCKHFRRPPALKIIRLPDAPVEPRHYSATGEKP